MFDASKTLHCRSSQDSLPSHAVIDLLLLALVGCFTDAPWLGTLVPGTRKYKDLC